MVLAMNVIGTATDSRDVIQPARHARISELTGGIPLVALPALVAIVRSMLAAWQFMWALSIAIFFGCKWETWVAARSAGVRPSAARSLGYLLLWPGMDARGFLSANKQSAGPSAKNWATASLKTLSGCCLLWLAAQRAAHGNGSLAVGWIGMIGLILTLHFGAFDLMALVWQAVGVAAEPIMRSPMLSTSLSEFWGKRWNLGFRQLTHGLVFQPARKRFGTSAATLLAFLASGLIHDLVISFPAGGGYGLPTAYFFLQGVGALAQRSRLAARLGIGTAFRGWLFTLAFTAGPVFWLFHPRFVRVVMLPFFAWIGSI